MQYQMYTIFLVVLWPYMSDVCTCKWSAGGLGGLSDLSIVFLMSPLTRLVKLNVDHIPYLPMNVFIYLSRSGDVLSQYISSRWHQCIATHSLLVNTVVGQY